MKTARSIMEMALGFVGIKENPAGTNNVLFNTHYYGREVSGNYPWCCAFVWDVFRLCGASILFYDGAKTAWCPAVQQWGEQARLTVPKTEAQYGDIVLFDWNKNDSPDHIGLVIARRGDVLDTVEGNTSETSNDNGGAVMRRTRALANVCCVIRPKYEEEISMSKTELEKLIDERAGEIADAKLEEALGKYVETIADIPHESVKREVRVLLDCGAINGGTSAEINPDDINLPYNLVRTLVMGKRYTDKKTE